jgi:predicted Zn-dependent protease
MSRRQSQHNSLNTVAFRRWQSTLRVLLLVYLIIEPVLAAANVPVNGRPQDLAFNSDDVQAMAANAYYQSLHELARHDVLDRNPQLLARVRRIAQPLIAQAILLKPEAAKWHWEIHIAQANQIDAYCMAGGKILVGAEFLEKQALTDGEIAALLAHEIAHAIAEHVREELSMVRRLSPDYAYFSLEEITGLLGWDLSVTLRLASLSRLQELEADDIGVTLAARAGFDPRDLVRFYRKLNRDGTGENLIDTHGSSTDRLRAVENFVMYAEKLYGANHGQEEYKIPLSLNSPLIVH